MRKKFEGDPSGVITDVLGIAKILKISERSVRQMVKDESIPFARIGGCIRFDINEVMKWFKQNSVKVS